VQLNPANNSHNIIYLLIWVEKHGRSNQDVSFLQGVSIADPVLAIAEASVHPFVCHMQSATLFKTTQASIARCSLSAPWKILVALDRPYRLIFLLPNHVTKPDRLTYWLKALFCFLRFFIIQKFRFLTRPWHEWYSCRSNSVVSAPGSTASQYWADRQRREGVIRRRVEATDCSTMALAVRFDYLTQRATICWLMYGSAEPWRRTG